MRPFGVDEALKKIYSEKLTIPKGIFIKMNPWWKFWLWFKPRTKRITMIKHLTKEAVLEE